MIERDDLSVLSPGTTSVTFRGRPLSVRPLQLRQLGAFTAAAKPIIGRALFAAGLLEEGQAIHVGAVLLDALEQHSTDLVTALAVATDEDAEFIGGGELGEICDLVEAVVERNEDFFVRRLPELIARLRPAVARLPRQSPSPDGATSSSSSSATATDTATS